MDGPAPQVPWGHCARPGATRICNAEPTLRARRQGQRVTLRRSNECTSGHCNGAVLEFCEVEPYSFRCSIPSCQQ